MPQFKFPVTRGFFSILLVFTIITSALSAQIGEDGTGTVRGYSIGPGANLSNADLFFANLENADLFGATLRYAVLTVANLTNADLTNADLTGVISGNIIGTPSLPTGYKMVNGYIVGPGVDLSGADLTGADLTGVISGNIIGTPSLPTGYKMVNGYIVGPGVDLSGANLTNTDLSGDDLTNTDLEGADLSGADLSGADLDGADLTGVLLSGTIWSNVISQSDYDAVVAERDARPTEAAYNAVVAERDAALAAQATAEAERDARLTESEVRDLRLGSSMLEVVDGDASINIELEATDNLGITNPTWTPVPESKVVIHPNFLSGKIKIDVEADDESNSGVRFYRFKLDD